MNTLRKLSPSETLIWSLDRLNPGCCTVAVSFKTGIAVESIIQAIRKAFSFRSSWNRSIVFEDDGFYFLEAPPAKVFFSEVKDLKRAALKNATTYLHHDLFSTQKCLAEITLLKENESYALSIHFHHVVADGISAIYTLLDILYYLDDPANYKVAQDIALPSLEEALEIDEEYVGPFLLEANKLGHLNMAIEDEKVESLLISESRVFSLESLATEYNLSLTSLVAAVLAKIISKTCTEKEDIFCLLPINMRPFLSENVPDTSAGYWLSRIDLKVACTLLEYPLIELAKKIYLDFQNQLRLNTHIDFIYAMTNYLVLADYSDADHFYLNARFKKSAALISNMGNIVAKKLEKIELTSIGTTVPCRGILENPNSCAVTMVGINGKYTINFHASINNQHSYSRLFREALDSLLELKNEN